MTTTTHKPFGLDSAYQEQTLYDPARLHLHNQQLLQLLSAIEHLHHCCV